MPGRTNALSEFTRLWLEHKHNLLVREGLAVPVPYALSDIDFLALHPLGQRFSLPGGAVVGPRLIVETKDEHDWEPTGREFGQALRADIALMGASRFIPKGTKGVKFTMLREQHYEKAAEWFGTEDFDRLFVVHALDEETRNDLCPELEKRIRVFWITARELVEDLLKWHGAHPRPAELRHTLAGDLFHLLVGFCNLRIH